jgi:hypothetical protein
VALELAQHRGRGIGGEAHRAADVEAVDRFEDPDARDLHEIVHRLPAPGVAVGERTGERQHLLGQLAARAAVAALVDRAQERQLPIGAPRSAADVLRLGHDLSTA